MFLWIDYEVRGWMDAERWKMGEGASRLTRVGGFSRGRHEHTAQLLRSELVENFHRGKSILRETKARLQLLFEK